MDSSLWTLIDIMSFFSALVEKNPLLVFLQVFYNLQTCRKKPFTWFFDFLKFVLQAESLHFSLMKVRMLLNLGLDFYLVTDIKTTFYYLRGYLSIGKFLPRYLNWIRFVERILNSFCHETWNSIHKHFSFQCLTLQSLKM